MPAFSNLPQAALRISCDQTNQCKDMSHSKFQTCGRFKEETEMGQEGRAKRVDLLPGIKKANTQGVQKDHGTRTLASRPSVVTPLNVTTNSLLQKHASGSKGSKYQPMDLEGGQVCTCEEPPTNVPGEKNTDVPLH